MHKSVSDRETFFQFHRVPHDSLVPSLIKAARRILANHRPEVKAFYCSRLNCAAQSEARTQEFLSYEVLGDTRATAKKRISKLACMSR